MDMKIFHDKRSNIFMVYISVHMVGNSRFRLIREGNSFQGIKYSFLDNRCDAVFMNR